jgi:hypothetical protein
MFIFFRDFLRSEFKDSGNRKVLDTAEIQPFLMWNSPMTTPDIKKESLY